MAKNTVPVNFKDDIINSSMGGKRRYKIINNSDGTISLEDATTYDQVGSNFGASQLNATNQAVNAAADAGKIIDDIEVIRNVTKEGYVAGALALKQVNSNLGGIEFNITDNKPQWRKVGADTWNFFTSGLDLLLTFSVSNPSYLTEHYYTDIVEDVSNGWKVSTNGNIRFLGYANLIVTGGSAGSITIKINDVDKYSLSVDSTSQMQIDVTLDINYGDTVKIYCVGSIINGQYYDNRVVAGKLHMIFG